MRLTGLSASIVLGSVIGIVLGIIGGIPMMAVPGGLALLLFVIAVAIPLPKRIVTRRRPIGQHFVETAEYEEVDLTSWQVQLAGALGILAAILSFIALVGGVLAIIF